MRGYVALARAQTVAGIVLTAIWCHAMSPAKGGEPVAKPQFGVGQPMRIAVEKGQSRFVMAAEKPGGQTLVVISPLTRTPGTYPITVSTRTADHCETMRLAADPSDRTSNLIAATQLTEKKATSPPPCIERTFFLQVRDGDPASPSNYRLIRGRLASWGTRAQIFMDEEEQTPVGDETLKDIVRTIDEHVAPIAAKHFGPIIDVDGDGRFTVLLTSWLGRLSNGRLSVDGFVRGADFDLSVAPPLGNRCDMMYLNTALVAGSHLRTVIAHEYTHAATYCRKALEAKIGDEEGWLDEGLAHLSEDLHNFSRSNLDYRVDAFLRSPDRFRLLVNDYASTGLIRSHGHRGSTYCFLRWCADQYGPELLGTLVRSKLRGVANLEDATGSSFDSLYRRWSIDLFLNALDPNKPLGPRFTSLRVGESDSWTSEATANHYVVIEDGGSRPVAIEVHGPADANLQVTAIQLPRDLPSVALNVEFGSSCEENAGVRVAIAERDDRPVRFLDLNWSSIAEDASKRLSGHLEGASLDQTLSRYRRDGEERMISQRISIPNVRPGDASLLFRLIGIDSHGRRITAWAEARPPVVVHEDSTAE